MPIVSGGGGGGGPAAGSYLPVANKAGVTVDATTYDDAVKGSGKLTTVIFPDDQGALAIALSGDAFPRVLLASDVRDGWYFGSGAIDPYTSGAFFAAGVGGNLQIGSQGGGTIRVSQARALAATDAAALNQISPALTLTSGALPTVQLVTATGAQIDTASDRETITPCTFNPGAATTATVTVALSPDNVTYSTLAVVTEPAGVALDGTILPVKVRVPAGWYLKLTVNAQAALGLTTYY